MNWEFDHLTDLLSCKMIKCHTKNSHFSLANCMIKDLFSLKHLLPHTGVDLLGVSSNLRDWSEPVSVSNLSSSGWTYIMTWSAAAVTPDHRFWWGRTAIIMTQPQTKLSGYRTWLVLTANTVSIEYLKSPIISSWGSATFSIRSSSLFWVVLDWTVFSKSGVFPTVSKTHAILCSILY